MIQSMLLCLVCCLCATAAGAATLTLTAADGVQVQAEFWPAPQPDAPLILAFHQAGSSHAEYAPLAPRLNGAGFSVLAIDQRSGGEAFGGRNATVSALGRSASYDAALPDLQAALAWALARTPRVPVLLWGSSYSAALVFKLAAQQPADVAGLLAFSPGEYLDDGAAVHRAARQVKVPVLIDQADSADELEQSRSILAATASRDKTLVLPRKGGVHGSATLRSDRNAAGAEENWAAVLRFLARFKPQR